MTQQERNDRHAVAAQRAQVAEQMLREVQASRAHLTELVAQFSSLTVNGILEQGVGVIPVDGAYGRDFRAPYAAVSIVNTGAQSITVAAAAKAGTAPGVGAGMFDVPAGAAMVRNMLGTSITFYGTAGGRFSYTVFTRPQPEAFGRVL